MWVPGRCVSSMSEKTGIIRSVLEVRPDRVGKVIHVEFLLGSTHIVSGDTFKSAQVNTDIQEL